MNYYSFHIGDYASHTRNLNLMEDLAYRRLLDFYYLNERPLNGCSTDVAREIGMQEEVKSVEYILNKFFVFNEESWKNTRADEEIEKYKQKIKQSSEAGRASQRKRIERSTVVQQAFNDRSTGVQPTNIKDKDINKEINIKEKNTKKEKTELPASPDFFEEFWNEYPNTHRRVAKAQCRKKWESKKLDLIAGKIIAHIKFMKKTKEWTSGFEPQTKTYLNEDRWESFIEQIVKQPDLTMKMYMGELRTVEEINKIKNDKRFEILGVKL